MENVDQIAFSLIADAGDAQELMMQALEWAKMGKYEQADTLLARAEEKMLKAHRVQTGLIKKEAEGAEFHCSVLMMHAMDHLMNAMLAKKLIQEIIYLHKTYEK
ncbi:hypothetical protein P22_2112 [Propionispora sp. 2/2-37]|uniref:PTS lactose/cellobiose transporter subunit IIA n=1 Tax=Propionispora sp. 2/2-37 TaxID=1677858 RepID=UPI0006BB8493|nr:PTS lactose/cellobiose transporter subunit IIA [Propionispora sp. 2/2-37]CUH96024.1 hypothetical protein P22_2112 [Propionispora sp. 2/2-37]